MCSPASRTEAEAEVEVEEAEGCSHRRLIRVNRETFAIGEQENPLIELRFWVDVTEPHCIIDPEA
jgi:hypothetical protein